MEHNLQLRESGLITEVDRYLFGEGTHYEIYEKLGAHPVTYNGKKGMYFAVWAPHADQVNLVGNFNLWNLHSHPMLPLYNSGIYELFVADLGEGELYKYAITTTQGKILFKADPYAFTAECRPDTASITADLSYFSWSDTTWINKRKKTDFDTSPISIYEVHIGSWKKKTGTETDEFYSYKEIAHELADYVTEMGYTYIELMGIAEHPYDGSWGYQVTGYYAPTSRYGTPADFMYFVDYMHKHGIGVILDWVPAHFPKDAHGLADFDGQALYEYTDPRQGEHADWGTKVFDYSKHEVSNFLISNALFWIEKYHIDGLRVDAVASMLYLDYGRQHGDWIPNQYGGNQNLDAVEFFKHLNSIVRKRTPGAVIIAEESTSWPDVTKKPEENGLGFHYKWNMGWMNDFLEYMKLDPSFRKHNHHKMTFSMTYFTSEKYILVLSHDEVVHLKCSMLEKMPGTYKEKFANLKAAYTFMIGHPGKKLLFMGQDFGQIHEWDENRSLDWYLTEEPLHHDLQHYVKDLLHLYKEYPALYETDYSWDGFQWVNANDAENSTFSFIRTDHLGKKNLLFIFNFSSDSRKNYHVGVPKAGEYTLLLDQKHGRYLPSDKILKLRAEKTPYDNQKYSITYSLPAYGTAILEF